MLSDSADRRGPTAVQRLRGALSERLGRPAASRGGKGRAPDWIVADPCFAVLQRGVGSHPRSYRIGFLVDDAGVWL